MEKQEFIDKYGNHLVKFSSYYKYSFTFNAELEDGLILSVTMGGNADDIYRDSISRDEQRRVVELDPYAGSVSKGGDEKESFFDI